tara:strand:- start:34148 stop:35695 length:1548 start_codon:yes stop_codon:yes gene_type:complete
MRENIKKIFRTSGVLLHPSSLPNSPVCGSFGRPARDWLRLLSKNGIGVWQFLPIAPTDKTGSPYSSPSGFSYNPWFIDVNDLVEEGFLPDSVFNQIPGAIEQSACSIDFSLADSRSQFIGTLLKENWKTQSLLRHQEFNLWRSNQFWLEDHAVFMELRRQFNDLPWWKWPLPFSSYENFDLKQWSESHQEKLLEHLLLQWQLDRQWKSLKSLAKRLGVILFGDIPFYVSRDSADVWSNPSLFSILKGRNLHLQSGVPPDYFSDDGQLWGTPVYRWKKHKRTRFRWWRGRFARHLEQVNLLRIDHFRALDSFWAVPGDDKTARNGYWRPSPGLELLSLLKKDNLGQLPLVAEDLGVITPGVDLLRSYFGLPGMKILQFAFDGNKDNPYLPENIKGNNWIVYTGTHDNQTSLGWWNELDDEKRRYIAERYNKEGLSPCWQLIEMGLSTEAKLFVAPIQDVLELDDKARLNKPGTIENNWSWRLESFDSELENSLRNYGNLSRTFERTSEDIFEKYQI